MLGVEGSRGRVPDPVSVDLIGREVETRALLKAYDAMTAGEPVVVQLSGVSGTGKTALAEHFLEIISKTRNPLILTARCYEAEAVPYKAWTAWSIS